MLGYPSVHKNTFQSLGRGDYQGPQCTSTCQVLKTSLEEQTRFSWTVIKGFIFLKTQKYKNNKMLLEMSNVLEGIVKDKCAYVHTWKENDNCYECLQCRVCYHPLTNPFKEQKPTNKTLGGEGTYCYVKKTRTSPAITIIYTRTRAKKDKNQFVYGIFVSTSHSLYIYSDIHFHSHFKTSVYSKSTRVSQPPTTVLSGL